MRFNNRLIETLLGIGLFFGRIEPGLFEYSLIFLTVLNFRKILLNPIDLLFLILLLLSSFSIFSVNYNIITCILFLGTKAITAKKEFFHGVSIGLVLSLFGILFDQNWLGSRYLGFMKDPNVLGSLALFSLLYFRTDPLKRTYKAVFNFICIVLIILTQSRGALIGLFLFFLLHFAQIESKKIKYISLISLTTIGVVLILEYSDLINTLMEYTRFSNAGYQDDRFKNWIRAIHLFLSYPLGVGGGMSAYYLGFNPHNMILQVLSENGLFATIVFVFLLIKSIRDNNRYFIVFLISCIPVDILHWKHFWIFINKPKP